MEDIVVVRSEGGKVDGIMKAMIFDDNSCLVTSRTSCFLLLLKNTRKEEFLHKN